jgi:hypothetical protein
MGNNKEKSRSIQMNEYCGFPGKTENTAVRLLSVG